MISLTPNLETLARRCPYCDSGLVACGWTIPGMRNFGEYRCPQCENEFFGDLPSGQGLYTPVLLDKKSGAIFGNERADWFSRWLADAYAARTSDPVGLEVRRFSTVKNKAVLLNCLDTLYGHSLLKLLNAQHHIDHNSDFDLIVMLPAFLEWMLPEGVAEAWIVNLPLRRGTEWNDWLANEIRDRLAEYSEVFLSLAFSHPNAGSFEIERFTRVRPFANDRFDPTDPVVTFIWRDDRLWTVENPKLSTRSEKIKNFLGASPTGSADDQTNKVVSFAESLRVRFPNLDFAVAGVGAPGGLPEWISDLRLTGLNAEDERLWCERYARSHCVVGVHGSNMLLPSAHAFGVIELISEDRLGNYLQDILFRNSDPRDMFFRYRFVSISTGPDELAEIASTIFRYRDFRPLMDPDFCTHQDKYDFERWLSD